MRFEGRSSEEPEREGPAGDTRPVSVLGRDDGTGHA